MKILFKKFADSEWSSENYLFYYDILTFQNMKSKEDQMKFAQEMFDNYLNDRSAPLEVNIIQQLCTEIKHRLENEDVDPMMFNSIEDEVIKNLLDTFSRFRRTRIYLNHLETKIFVESQVIA